MREVIEIIDRAEPEVLENILKSVLRRYAELYPEWEMNLFSLKKMVIGMSRLIQSLGFYKT